VGVLVLVNLCWVDVDVNDARMCRKRLKLAGDTVVKAHTQCNHQISLCVWV
jgi:hypothetical protein